MTSQAHNDDDMSRRYSDDEPGKLIMGPRGNVSLYKGSINTFGSKCS
jgi:hypothetical protein